jgi:hypothetical protein
MSKPTKSTQSDPAKGAPKKVPNREQSKKIVNSRQTPWGLIISTVAVAALAIGVIGFAVSKNQNKKDQADPSKIAGLITKDFPSGQHVTGVIKYEDSPPFGGQHNPYWADCTGTVYPNPIASENAVHTLEHGAVWITYKPGLAADQVDILSKLVAGQQFMIMSPYPGLKTNVSLQAWGHQLFVDSASDPRVERFISSFRLSTKFTPEMGARCDNTDFKKSPSTPGHPWSPTAPTGS